MQLLETNQMNERITLPSFEALRRFSSTITSAISEHSMSSTTVVNTVNTVSNTFTKRQNQYLTISIVKGKEDYGQYLLHTPESKPHDKEKTPRQ